jgi:hypothetical protein
MALLNSFAEFFHGLGYALVLVENGGTGDEQVGSCLHNLWNCSLVNAPINFYIAFEVPLDNHLPDVRDFGQNFRDEVLSPKSWVNGHDEHKVDEREDILEHESRCRWVKCYASLFSCRFDLLDNAMQVRTNLLVYDDDVCSSFGEVLDILLWIGNHQVSFEGETGAASHRFDDYRPHRNVGDEVPVHDIDLDTLSTSRLGLTYLLTQPRKIRR